MNHGIKLADWARTQGIDYLTAWRMVKAGTLAHHRLPNGMIIVDLPAPPAAAPVGKVVVYTRVSAAENKSNLDSQAARLVNFCLARGWQVNRVVKEVGSGVNDGRKQFLALLADESVTRIVVEHKDRASRFGVAYIQTLLKNQGRELVIANEAAIGEEDLMGDLVAIITSFTARLYGRRRAKRKTAAVLKCLQADAEAGA